GHGRQPPANSQLSAISYQPEQEPSVLPAWLIADSWLLADGSHRVRAAAPAGALGLRVGDGEAALVQVVVEVHHGPAQVEQRPLVHDHFHPVELELVVGLLVELRVEVELVLEPAAPAALD